MAFILLFYLLKDNSSKFIQLERQKELEEQAAAKRRQVAREFVENKSSYYTSAEESKVNTEKNILTSKQKIENERKEKLNMFLDEEEKRKNQPNSKDGSDNYEKIKSLNDEDVAQTVEAKCNDVNNTSKYLMIIVPSNLIKSGKFNPDAYSFQSFKSLRVFDYIEPPINTTKINTDQFESVIDSFRGSIFSCGTTLEGTLVTPPLKVLFLSEKHIKSGYKNKFFHLYKIGHALWMDELQKKGLTIEINYNSPDVFLKQFSEIELTHGERIKKITENTLVLLVGDNSFNVYSYYEFVNIVKEDQEYLVLDICNYEDI